MRRPRRAEEPPAAAARPEGAVLLVRLDSGVLCDWVQTRASSALATLQGSLSGRFGVSGYEKSFVGGPPASSLGTARTRPFDASDALRRGLYPDFVPTFRDLYPLL